MLNWTRLHPKLVEVAWQEAVPRVKFKMKRRFSNIIQIKMYYLYKERITGGQQMVRTREKLRSNHRRCSLKFGNFTRKHLCWSLSLIKLQHAWRPKNFLTRPVFITVMTIQLMWRVVGQWPSFDCSICNTITCLLSVVWGCHALSLSLSFFLFSLQFLFIYIYIYLLLNVFSFSSICNRYFFTDSEIIHFITIGIPMLLFLNPGYSTMLLKFYLI